MISFVDLAFSLERRRGWIASAVGFTAVTLALVGGLATSMEETLQTLRDRARSSEASGRIAIVEIDAASLAVFNRWPWPRSVHGAVVREADRLGAASIAFDVDFSARSTQAEDAAFATALAAAKRAVILPTFRQAAGDRRRGREVENLPIAMLREHAVLGAVNVHADRDGLVRRMSMGVMTDGAPRPSLPALVAGTPGMIGESFPVDYGIDPATIPRISYADLVRGRIPVNAVAGRDLIIGTTAIENGDRYPVPGHGVVPGVVIQALAAETLRRSGVPFEPGPLPGLIGAAAAVTLAMRLKRRWARWSMPLVVAASLGGGALLFDMSGTLQLQIAPALILLAAAGAALATIGHLARISRQHLVDDATGLGNTAALARLLDAEPHVQIGVAAIRQHQSLAALLGPGRLDELVRRLAERLESVAPPGRIWRVEENAVAFAVAGWEADDLEASFDGLTALMRAPFFSGGRMIDVPVAFGFAEGAGASAATLVGDAVFAAAEAAERGVRWAAANSAGDQDEAQWQLSILSELDAALADGSVWIAYQPKFDIASSRIKGAEALIRWRHPTRGPIPPDRFIPQVEARGQMLELTLHVLRRALADMVGLSEAGTPIGVAVNLSTTLLPRAGLADVILKLVAESGVDPSLLTLEVTESAAVELSPDTIGTLERLRAAGIRISVDDYGTGQSTITYLRRFPAQELKIDKSFVQAMLDNPSDAILVRSTIEMAHELGLSVVAEGVEDEVTLTALSALGCDTIQGYHVGKPMPLAEFAALIGAPPVETLQRAA